MIGGQAQKESIIGVIITLLMPAPIKDPFPAWKPPILMPQRTSERQEMSRVEGFGCLQLVLYDIGELA